MEHPIESTKSEQLFHLRSYMRRPVRSVCRSIHALVLLICQIQVASASRLMGGSDPISRECFRAAGEDHISSVCKEDTVCPPLHHALPPGYRFICWVHVTIFLCVCACVAAHLENKDCEQVLNAALQAVAQLNSESNSIFQIELIRVVKGTQQVLSLAAPNLRCCSCTTRKLFTKWYNGNFCRWFPV